MAGALTPEQRRLRAQIAANARWAKERDRTAATRAGTDAFLAKFLDEVDPNRELDPAEREKRAKNARTAHFQRLAYASAKARKVAS